jgi:hypothetical protein
MLTSSALAVLAAAGWWWATWPERTAREFVTLIAENKLNEAQAMMFDPAEAIPCRFCQHIRSRELRPGSRTLTGIATGEQIFFLERNYFIRVERGSVGIGWATMH